MAHAYSNPKRTFVAGSLSASEDEEDPVGRPATQRNNMAHAYSNQKRTFASGSLSASEDEQEPAGRPAKQRKMEMGLPDGAHFANDFIIPQGGSTEPSAEYSSVASKLMGKMGYKEGAGLGKHGQGRVNIVEASMQKGRRGLGAEVRGFEATSDQWDFSKEEVPIREKVAWLPSYRRAVPQLDEMRNWMQLGQKKLILDDEDKFCSPEILRQVLECKSIFDNLEDEEMRKARTRSNPYETIRGVFFLNRAAMKMANMDSLLDYMFTSPKTKQGRPAVGPGELLYFADICAGPGGFSEYVLWRKKWNSKGFGFTLKGNNDFKLDEFFAAPSQCFEPFYGVGGEDGDGDIYRPDNLCEFQNFVLQNTDGHGVHFVMADGGFSVEGQENLQEILSKRLYLCQFLCSLMILREGGHFVCKLFDIFTPFSVGLVYLMYCAFEHVSIIKPVTSRPANSERYLVCKWKRADSDPIRDYMFYVNQQLDKLSSIMCSDDVTEVVPMELMRVDTEFFEYIYESNNELGRAQAIALVKIQVFAKNSTLHETRQSKTRELCLQAWSIPDQVRQPPERSLRPETLLSQLTNVTDGKFLQDEVKLEPSNVSQLLKSAYDYKCFIRAADERYILISVGKCALYKWNGAPGSMMHNVEDLHFDLPRNTVLEVEFLNELRGEGKGQRRIQGLHIIDAMFLYGEDVRSLHYMERIDKIKKFTRAIHRPSDKKLAPIRVKEIFRCEDLIRPLERLAVKKAKGGGGMPRLCFCSEETSDQQSIHFLPVGICFLRTVKDPYMMAWSRSAGKKYFFHTLTREAVFETPKDCIADFTTCQKHRLLWSWEPGVKLHPEQPGLEDLNKLSKDVLLNHIHSLLPKVR